MAPDGRWSRARAYAETNSRRYHDRSALQNLGFQADWQQKRVPLLRPGRTMARSGSLGPESKNPKKINEEREWPGASIK